MKFRFAHNPDLFPRSILEEVTLEKNRLEHTKNTERQRIAYTGVQMLTNELFFGGVPTDFHLRFFASQSGVEVENLERHVGKQAFSRLTGDALAHYYELELKRRSRVLKHATSIAMSGTVAIDQRIKELGSFYDENADPRAAIAATQRVDPKTRALMLEDQAEHIRGLCSIIGTNIGLGVPTSLGDKVMFDITEAATGGQPFHFGESVQVAWLEMPNDPNLTIVPIL